MIRPSPPPRVMTAVLGLCVACFVLAPQFATAQPAPTDAPPKTKLQRTIQGIVNKARKKFPKTAKVEVAVRDNRDGKILAKSGADDPVNLASVTKIISTTAALDLVGASKTFSTRILASKPLSSHVKVLAISGSGDPSLSETDLVGLALRVRNAGIKRVDKILVHPGPSGPTTFPPGFKKKKTTAGYRAPVGGLNLNHNRIRVQLIPGAKIGDPVIVRLSPAAHTIKIENSAKTARGKRDKIGLSILWKNGYTPTVRVKGSLGIKRHKGITATRLNAHPEGWVAQSFRSALIRAGVKVPGHTIRTRTLPKNLGTVAKHESPSLLDLVKTTLSHSDNQYAESMLLHLAKPSSKGFKGGIERIQGWLELMGLSLNKIKIFNGSGLYDGGFASALEMTRLLNLVSQRTDLYPELLAALAVPGQSGTLRRRMKDLPKGSVRAKTGTLNETSTLCGYVMDGLKSRSFCVLVNGIDPGYTRIARALQDQVVRAIHHDLIKRAAPPRTKTSVSPNSRKTAANGAKANPPSKAKKSKTK